MLHVYVGFFAMYAVHFSIDAWVLANVYFASSSTHQIDEVFIERVA